MVSLLFVLFLELLLKATTERTTEFIFHGFKGNQSQVQLQGDSTIKPNGLLRLTDRNSNVAGTAFFHKPVSLLNKSNDFTVRSFSTSFVFIIIPSSSNNGGFGFTFTLSPTPNRTDAESAQYLGLLNERNDGDPSNHVFAVEFDTVQGFKDSTNRIGNHIGLDFNSLSSDVQEPVAYYNDDGKKEEFQLASGEPIQVSVDYDGPTKTLNLTVYPTRLGFRPTSPLISRQVPKLSDIVKDEMFVGFTAATGRDRSSAHYLMGWSFSSGGANPIAATLNLSELPPPPPNTAKKRGYNGKVVALIVALSTCISIMLVLLLIFMIYRKRMQQEEILEDWEIDHPHRFRYRDLYTATDGFKESRIVGTGGFGTVYRGGSISSSSPDQIAVKKITPNSMQGVREFVAEIESLGRLRHKNLVNLQGCGNSSTASDVYAFGVLLLEMVSGRKPTDSGSFFLADWVMELQASGEILGAVDPRLGSSYEEGEARLALAVGLLCCHPKMGSRPQMRMVIRYLSRDEDVPEIDQNWGYSDSSISDLGSKFGGYVSSDRASSSHTCSSSLTRISSASFISGR
ncbi:unnamed protein product [Thlaspi arvense]|uniref:Protein kinase domain-containing protein n=1 Tax=Thlaspi arvense TaxID=13288 RepID=A0AAU9SWY5_THLAR|nr:unnamed protein product [Thlaspi arvense]